MESTYFYSEDTSCILEKGNTTFTNIDCKSRTCLFQFNFFLNDCLKGWLTQKLFTIYSPSCCSNPLCVSFFFQTQRGYFKECWKPDSWWLPLTLFSHYFFFLWKTMATVNCFTNSLQNIFFCVQQKSGWPVLLICVKFHSVSLSISIWTMQSTIGLVMSSLYSWSISVLLWSPGACTAHVPFKRTHQLCHCLI